MAGHDKVLGPCLGINELLHGLRPIRGRDSGRGPFGSLNRHGKCGAEQGSIIVYHHRYPELIEPLSLERYANKSSALPRHKSDFVRSATLRRYGKVTLILAILVINDDDKIAVFKSFDDTLNLGKILQKPNLSIFERSDSLLRS